ncbi:MAG: extracellular solute-binding protein [Defluviitaleaceae bacterium]|nr:extracellular solute-binding protein [Defluviitaleaceae bacterium]MCL2263509.1 extracellular solute-binding protein [Defluviitaleaceae bacterium]
MKKHFIFAILATFVLAFTACGGNGEGGNEAEPGLVGNGGGGAAADAERDLGGMVINIATWWADECTETADRDVSISARARWDDRQAMEERYNFRIRYVRYGSWQDVRDDIQQQIMGENRNYHIWTVEPTWFATHHTQGLFAPIPMHHFQDDYGIEWNESLLEVTMRDGMPHGFAHGVEMAGGVYFNKRLLEEAGFPRDYPFQLQADNNWTWATFTDLARHLSRDEDGDGVMDTWALTTFHQDFLNAALASNGAAFATVDPVTGRFVNATNTDAFRETLEWVVSLRDEMLTMHEEDVGGEWDVFRQMFNDGQGAMRVANNYVAGEIFPMLADEWGFVAFPRGPRSAHHYSWVSQDIMVIPHFYSAEEIDNIMFAMQKWVRPLEDDDPDDWIFEARDVHRDPRSVTETMANFTRNPDLQVMPAHEMLPGLGHTLNDLFAWNVWTGNEASVIIEEAQLVWDAFLNDINDMQVGAN